MKVRYQCRRLCPLCGSSFIYRSRPTSPSERWLLPLLLLRSFRCRNCSSRYWGFVFARRRISLDELNLA